MPPGQWNPWLPEIVRKHLDLVGVLLSAISFIIYLVLWNILNKNGELSIWLSIFTKNIITIFNLPNTKIIKGIFAAALALILVAIILFIHEILHLFITIGKGDLYMYWNKSLLGISPHSDCELTWEQSLIYKLMPFIVLSVGFYIVALCIGGGVGGFLKYIALLNLSISCGDLLLTPFMFIIPRNAVFYGGMWKVDCRLRK
jgi:hypothetical protein